METQTMKLDAVPSNVTQAIEFVAGFAGAAGCPENMQNQLSVCVDEIFANIAQHAYAGGAGKVRIDVAVLGEPAAIQIAFRDRGVAFNSLEREDPDVTLTAEQRSVGGLGIFITKKIADEVRYQRDGDYNILTIVKQFPKG